MTPTATGMEIHTEEFQVRGLAIKVYIRLDPITKNYSVLCKAFDSKRAMLWSTELLNEEGKPQTFHSLPTAVSKIRNVFKEKEYVVK